MSKRQTSAERWDEFSLDDPKLPAWIEENAFRSGDYPYDKRMKRKKYDRRLTKLQIEMLKVQRWLDEERRRLVVVFEGRDAAGKGGTIMRMMQHLNPRHAHIAALTKPTEEEQGQWYFQRYVRRLPTAGDMTVFDRSWYNRAGVEPVMGFCTPEQTAQFLREAPKFETMLTDDGIILAKFWLNVGREMQLKRFHDRRHDPLKTWKLSEVDLKGLSHWDDYGRARDAMMQATHTDNAPWTVVKSNDKLRLRLNVLRSLLARLDYSDKDADAIGEVDPKIVDGPSIVHGS
ncbi:MAG: polyphosphate kinase 2 [Flavobacteriaceae bacterium]